MTVEYLWDANGNMTRDRNKKIWRIRYNVLNLPEEIKFYDGHVVRYTYAADGRKLKVEYQISNMGVLELNGIDAGATMGLMGEGIPTINPPSPTTYLTMDYCGNHVYRNGKFDGGRLLASNIWCVKNVICSNIDLPGERIHAGGIIYF